MKEPLVFVTRPNGLPIWLPEWIAQKLGVSQRDQLTEGQYSSREVVDCIATRLRAESGKAEVQKP